jgi:hypothetical protein
MPFLVIYVFSCALKFVVLLFQLLVYSRKENLDLWWLAVCSLSVILPTTISTYKWWSCSPCDLLTESKHLLHSHFYESSCFLIFLYCISFRFGVFICVGSSVCWCSYLCCFVDLLMFLLVLFCLSVDVFIVVVWFVCWCFHLCCFVCLLMFYWCYFVLSVNVYIDVVLSICWCCFVSLLMFALVLLCLSVDVFIGVV